MTLEQLRKEIDLLDDQIIPLLQKRFSLVKQLKPHKKNPTDSTRETAILLKIDPQLPEYLAIVAVYQALFQASKQLLTPMIQVQKLID